MVTHRARGALSAFKRALGHKGAERALGSEAGEKFPAKQCLLSCDLPAGRVAEGCFAFKDH